MASGDTKTEAMLNVLGNGGSGDEFRGCCNTKTQSYILDAIDRVQAVEDEVERLENNPDVADIVDTYQDLQNYDKSSLTDKDVIRVLNDETHDGDSTYYRYSTDTGDFTYIGESKQYTNFVGTDGVSAGKSGLVPAPATTDAGKFLKSDGTWGTAGGSSSGVKFLTSADYNYPTNNPTSVNPGMLNPGIYFVADETVNVFNGANSLTSRQHLVFVISASDGVTGQNEMMVINDTTVAADGDYKINFYYTTVSTGVTVRRKGLLDETYIADNLTTNSAAKVLSAKQGRALNQKILAVQEGNTGGQAPTAIGSIGQVYIDTSSADAYMCTSTTGGVYTWKKITN